MIFMAKFADFSALDRWKGHILDAIDEKESTTHEHEFINGEKVVVSNTVPTVNDENVITFYVSDGTVDPGGGDTPQPTYTEAEWGISHAFRTMHPSMTTVTSYPYPLSISNKDYFNSQSQITGYRFVVGDNSGYSSERIVRFYDNDTGREMAELYGNNEYIHGDSIDMGSTSEQTRCYISGMYNNTDFAGFVPNWTTDDIGTTKTMRIEVICENERSIGYVQFAIEA